MKIDNDGLKNIEILLEKLLDELSVEVISSDTPSTLPIPTNTFLEMEELIGERIYFIGLS